MPFVVPDGVQAGQIFHMPVEAAEYVKRAAQDLIALTEAHIAGFERVRQETKHRRMHSNSTLKRHLCQCSSVVNF